MNDLMVRRAAPTDAETLINMHARAIRSLCASDYKEDQINAWIGNRTAAAFVERIITRPSFVAGISGMLVGYAIYNPGNLELQSIFVDPDFARKGVASALMVELLAHAKSEGLEMLWLDSSLTAVPFYERVGFVKDIETVHRFGGVPLECVRMEISLKD